MLKSLYNCLKLQYVESGPCVNSLSILENSEYTESKYLNNAVLRKNIESSYSLLYINLANKLNGIGRNKELKNNRVLNVCYTLSNYFKKVTPYLVNESYLSTTSLLCGHVDYLTIDLTGNSISHIKFDNPKNLNALLQQLSSVIKENFDGNNRLKIMFKLDLIEILNRVESENKLFSILDEINSSDTMYGIILDSNITSKDGYKVFNDEINVKRILDSLDLVKNYKLSRKEVKLKVITNDGVRNGEDITNYYQKGADFVTFSTLFITEGPFCVERLVNELAETSFKLV